MSNWQRPSAWDDGPSSARWFSRAPCPGVLTGLRFGVLAAWLALVVVEQLNATSGIGYMINLARTYAQSDVILVGLVVYALLGLSSDAAVRFLERRSLAWRRSFSA